MFKLSFRDFDAGHRGAATEERPPPPELRALTMRGVCRPPRTGSVAADGLGGRRWLRWPPMASVAADGCGGRSSVAAPRWPLLGGRSSVAATGGHRRPPGGPKGPPVVFKAPPGAEAARRRMSYDIKCYWRSTFSLRFVFYLYPYFTFIQFLSSLFNSDDENNNDPEPPNLIPNARLPICCLVC